MWASDNANKEVEASKIVMLQMQIGGCVHSEIETRKTALKQGSRSDNCVVTPTHTQLTVSYRWARSCYATRLDVLSVSAWLVLNTARYSTAAVHTGVRELEYQFTSVRPLWTRARRQFWTETSSCSSSRPEPGCFQKKDVAIIRALNPEAKAVACGNTG